MEMLFSNLQVLISTFCIMDSKLTFINDPVCDALYLKSHPSIKICDKLSGTDIPF